MPTEVYKIRNIYTVDGVEIEIIPLKIKYLKQLMESFSTIDITTTEDETVNILSDCVRIAMTQYMPGAYKTVEDVQDNFDLKTIYKVLEYSAGINLLENKTEKEKTDESEPGSSWDTLDLAKLETEVFLLGIWKNFDELETSICIEELMQILSITRDLDYQEKKFLAAIQGIDLDGAGEEEKGQKEWEDLKARVASGGNATDSRDILALQGMAAKQAGFGIGLGLGYQDMRDPNVMKK